MRRCTIYLGGGTIHCTIAFIVAAGSLDLLKLRPTFRPDLECSRLWNCRAIRSHQVREELAFTALKVWLEIVKGLGKLMTEPSFPTMVISSERNEQV